MSIQEPLESVPPWDGEALVFLLLERATPQAVLSLPAVSLLESLSSRKAGYWWLLFHLGLLGGGG